jgi:hypothetical protein
MEFVVKFLAVAALLLSLAVDCQAGLKSVSRQSSRTQSRSGSYGHFVGVPLGHYEGVAVASTRRDAIRNACYSNDRSKVAVSKTVTRGPNGMFYSSVLYRNR